jgi:hypothetical protein
VVVVRTGPGRTARTAITTAATGLQRERVDASDGTAQLSPDADGTAAASSPLCHPEEPLLEPGRLDDEPVGFGTFEMG